MRWALRFAIGGLVAFALAAAGYYWALGRIEAPGPLAAETAVLIPRGSGVEAIAILLGEAGVVDSPLLFMAAVKISGADKGLRAGEYAFPPGVSIAGVIGRLRSGVTVVRRLTVPEGLTATQILALLREETGLAGEIDGQPKDGTLLPETYHFSYGDTRAGLIERMRKGMEEALAEAWAARAPDLPFDTPGEAVVLASIIEKETGVAEERARVAGVFVNRLRLGMRLQSDPTVIYGLTGGETELDRPLTRADWKHDSPYNTYQIDGLPPSPIANPGRASIAAALNPENHDFLYFVADGTGGHAFAKTLAEHNRNVRNWRAVQRGER